MTYLVTKLFTDGLLKGLTITERTAARFTKGQEVKSLAGSSYRVIDIRPA